MIRPHTKQLRAFFSKVDLVDDKGCWIWGSALTGAGWATYRGTSAYRFTYSWFVEQIPPGYDVDHLCCNPLCVNPAHLEAVTRRENVLRMVRRRGWDTHCKRGHLLAGNTWRNGTAGLCCKTVRA